MNQLIWPQSIPTLITKDLVLRPIVDTDAASYFELCRDIEVMRAWGTAAHQSLQDTLDLIQYLDRSFQNQEIIRWGITVKGAEDTIIGDAGFWRFVKVRCRGEVGAKLARPYWKRSFTSQALERVIQYAFEEMNLHSAEGNAEPENLASIRMIEKIGFIKEGLLHEHSYNAEKGRFVDTYIYSLLKSRFRPSINV